MGLQNLYSLFHRCRERGWGPRFSESGTDFFFFLEPSSNKNFEHGWVSAVRGVVEIKSLQVPGERTQSAKRAKERRRDKRFLFKLIPLRPSRFPSQDSQKSDKNLALWIRRETGRVEGEEERWFRGGGGTERTEGKCGGERSQLRQIKGRQVRQEGWAHSSEGVSRHRCVPVKSQSRQDCAISYQTCVVCLMMCSTN